MKKSLIVIVVISVLMLMYVNLPKDENTAFFFDNNGFTLDYDNVDVEESHELVMDSNDSFHVDIKSRKGIMNISIKDSNGVSIYDGKNVPTSKFDVKVSEADTYVIVVNGDDVSGKVELQRIKKN